VICWISLQRAVSLACLYNGIIETPMPFILKLTSTGGLKKSVCEFFMESEALLSIPIMYESVSKFQLV
jgi:hypothetical protein